MRSARVVLSDAHASYLQNLCLAFISCPQVESDPNTCKILDRSDPTQWSKIV